MTSSFYAGLIAFIVTALLALVIYLIRQLILSKDRQIETLQCHISVINTQLDEVQNELEDLKQRKRQTGPTLAGIEDIQAALTRIKFERAYQDELLDASLNTLSQIRKGPYAYDPNTPSISRKDP
jgi:uncharacterized protein YoxC